MAGLAWPALRGLRKNYALETTAQDISDCMAFARASAVAQSAWYELDFMQSSSYRLYKLDSDNGSIARQVPAPGRWGAGKSVAADIELDAPSSPIFFYPNGTATAATVVLKGPNAPPLSIHLNGTLGYATISQ